MIAVMRLHSGPCRDCGVDIGTSTNSARSTRRCTACYNRRQRLRVRGMARTAARVDHRAVTLHQCTTREAESLADLRRWDEQRNAQRAKDIAAIEAITDEYRPARRREP